MQHQQLIQALISLLCFIPALVFHEFMHAWVAYKLGDPTAQRAGRLSFNPLKHLDPFGSVLLPALLIFMHAPVFGYAKPVPYNPRYFKNPRKGDVLVGLAGPLGNLILALVAAGISLALTPMVSSSLPAYGLPNSSELLFIIYFMFLPRFIMVNLVFMFFNLLPIPPLDGSSLFALIIPAKWMPGYYRVQQYMLPILLMLMFVLPQFLHIDIIMLYLQATAGTLSRLIAPWYFSNIFTAFGAA